MDRLLRRRRTIVFFVAPALVFYLLIVPIPILRSIYDSFFDWNVIGARRFVGLGNYIELFRMDFIFKKALLNTLIYTVESVLLQIPLALLLAYLLLRRFPLQQFFRSVYFLPSIISGTAIGLMWKFIYHGETGLLNVILRGFGFEADMGWLSNPGFAIHGVAIACAWQFFGYHMVLFLSGISTISGDVLESAEIDGASRLDIFFRIVLPLIRPFLMVSLVMITANSVKAFDNVLALTGGGPGNASMVLALHMYTTAFRQMRYGYGSAIAVVLLLINILFSGVINRLTVGKGGDGP